MIECPGSCKIVVNDQTVMALITDPRLIFPFLSSFSKTLFSTQGQTEVPASHHQQLRAVQQVSKNEFNGWHHSVSELDNHSLLARLLRWCPSPDCSNAVKVRKWILEMTKILNVLVNYFFVRCNMLKHDQWNVPVATLSVSPAGCHSRTLHQVTCLYFEYPCMVNKIPMTWLFSVRTGTTLWGATWSRSGSRSVMTTGALRSNGDLIDC